MGGRERFIIVLAALLAGCVWLLTPAGRAKSGKAGSIAKKDDSNWAKPVYVFGADNLYQVSPDLYRGEQPTADGFKGLLELGIKTDINLRHLHSDDDELGNLPLKLIEIKTDAWENGISERDVIEFLKVFADRENLPAFVHCKHGADRTGTMCAIYRVAFQGWSKERAIEEMTEGPYGHHGKVWRSLPGFIRSLDIERLKREAGVAEESVNLYGITPDNLVEIGMQGTVGRSREIKILTNVAAKKINVKDPIAFILDVTNVSPATREIDNIRVFGDWIIELKNMDNGEVWRASKLEGKPMPGGKLILEPGDSRGVEVFLGSKWSFTRIAPDDKEARKHLPAGKYELSGQVLWSVDGKGWSRLIPPAVFEITE